MLLGRVVSLLLQMPDLCIHKTMYSISPTAGKCTKLLWWKTAYFYGVPSRGFPTVIFFFKYLLELNFQVRIKKFFLENWAKIHLVIFFHLKKKINISFISTCLSFTISQENGSEVITYFQILLFQCRECFGKGQVKMWRVWRGETRATSDKL